MKKPPIRVYNSLTRSTEIFQPIIPHTVRMYSCGPTVYDRAHIGNLRAFIFADILSATLKSAGYKVNHIINITDVGHLTDDADEGEDKIEKAAKKSKKNAYELARYYEDLFYRDIKALSIAQPSAFPRATEFIDAQISFIKGLEKNGFTYQTKDGIYFNTAKLDNYHVFPQNKDVDDSSRRTRIKAGKGKKHSEDFALWKFSIPGTKRQMEWDSPWGRGFPGWHIECSAMSMALLGFPFDIHTGGIDHLPIHHTNEIAQNRAYVGNTGARIWMHNAFVTVDGQKMSKSLGNVYTLDDLRKNNIPPLAYRYLVLSSHYRHIINFSWEAAKNAVSSLTLLRTHYARNKAILSALPFPKRIFSSLKPNSSRLCHFLQRLFNALYDDLHTPQALAVLWDAAKNPDLTASEKISLFNEADRVLRIFQNINIHPPEPYAMLLVRKREQARREKNYSRADNIREELLKLGYIVEDYSGKTLIYRRPEL